jgi:hypothetical protein
MRNPLALSVVVCLLVVAGQLAISAQSINLLNTRMPVNVSSEGGTAEPPAAPRQWAIPAGATAAVDNTDAGTGLGPILGIQFWQQDKYFGSFLFSQAPETEITGSQREFGTFLLSPPFTGTSFSGGFNKILGQPKGMLAGLSGRAGITRMKWSGNVSPSLNASPTLQTAPGDIAYIGGGVLLMSPTFKRDDRNEYQFGVEGHWTWRSIIGDLASLKNDSFRQTIIGTTDTNFNGPELTFFVRLNSAQPFLRLSRVKSQGESSVDGLHGWQTFFGMTVLSAIFQDSTAGQIEIESPDFPDAFIQQDFSYHLQAAGGKQPYKFIHVSGTLPDGLTLNDIGLLRGKPTIAQTYKFKVRASDWQNLQSDAKELTLKVKVPAPVAPKP